MKNALGRFLVTVLAFTSAGAVIVSVVAGSGIAEAQTPPPPSSRNPAQDFDTLKAAGNTYPEGIWSDGTTMWVADSNEDKIYAYKISDKSRDSSKDFDLDSALTPAPTGIWSNSTTMWVTDYEDDKIYAYKMSDKSRDSSKDFDLDSALTPAPAGIWSDGTTMWVTDAHFDKLYAYKMSDKSRDSSKDFTLHQDHDDAYGIWSDGVTMWVSDYIDKKLYAYKMSDKSRDSSKDVSLESSYPYGGIWSDGDTIWVADYYDEKIFAYHLTPPDDLEESEQLVLGTSPSEEATVRPAPPPPRPRVLGPRRVSVAEEGGTAVGAYTALFSGSPITPAWSLSGADAALFGITGDGALAFLEPPDHERPRDRDAAAPGDNVYVVTLNATADSGETGALTVRVTVTDAGGRFHIPPAAGALTAFTGSLAQFRDELTDTCPGGAATWSTPVRDGRADWASHVPDAPAPAVNGRGVRGGACRRLRLDAAARHALRSAAARRVRRERRGRGRRRRGPPRGRGLRRAGRRGVVALRRRRGALHHPRRRAALRRAARPRVARRRRRRQRPPRHRRGGGGRRDGLARRDRSPSPIATTPCRTSAASASRRPARASRSPRSPGRSTACARRWASGARRARWRCGRRSAARGPRTSRSRLSRR